MPLAGELMSAVTSLIALVGPTGSGKTALAVALAERFNGEVVNADSRQVYRHMDIGTAKPSAAEQTRIPHHLLDIRDPDQVLSVAEYQDYANAAIQDVAARGRLPLLVGGSGQYVTATIEGWQTPEVPPDSALRAALQADADQFGYEALYQRLIALDPASAEIIDGRNVRRVIRALEVCLISGQPFSQQRLKQPPPYHLLELGLTMERIALDSRLDARIDRMLEHGLLDEVRRLLDMGYDRHLSAMSSLGYRQLGAYLAGETDWPTAVRAFKQATRQFARRQMTWFNHHGAPMWLDAAYDSFPAASEIVAEWLTTRNSGNDVFQTAL